VIVKFDFRGCECCAILTFLQNVPDCRVSKYFLFLYIFLTEVKHGYAVKIFKQKLMQLCQLQKGL